MCEEFKEMRKPYKLSSSKENKSKSNALKIMVNTFYGANTNPYISYGDMAVVDGTYTFEMNVNGGREEVPARYTFVLRKKNHRWLIVSHHSSAQP